ncbi:transposase [Streptomyces sp. NPDC093808]|uniref:transposase n=1 Tax=Streptomyces sp. NPDC093808 TaxID=3154985 RepID=UPI00344BD416
MGSKYTKRYTEEFKRDAIALVDSSGKTVTAVARELGISSESLRGWYRRAKADQGEGAPGELTSAEREELRRLRRENREQQQTIELLKKATLELVSRGVRWMRHDAVPWVLVCRSGWFLTNSGRWSHRCCLRSLPVRREAVRPRWMSGRCSRLWCTC